MKKRGMRVSSFFSGLTSAVLVLMLFSPVLKAGELTLLMMGDLLLANAVEKRMHQYGFDYPFSGLKQEMSRYDLVFANLETSITDRGVPHPTKKYTFRMGRIAAEYIKTLPLSVVSVSNNHMLDYGVDGLYDTLEFLDESPIKYTGAGFNLDQARLPAVIRKNGHSLAFLAYCERPPADFYATSFRPGTAPVWIDYIKDDIARLSMTGSKIIISLHWGIELDNYPRKDQIRTAHELIDAGADMIVGHHPHVPQGIEIYRGKPIFYSLGNAVIGFYNSRYSSNIMAAVKFRNNMISEIEIIPISGDNYEIEFRPEVEKGEAARRTVENLALISSGFGTDIFFDELTEKGRVNLSGIYNE